MNFNILTINIFFISRIYLNANCDITSCSVSIYKNTTYALCNGTYTIETAIEACNKNGYDLVDFELIKNETVLNNFKPQFT